MIDFYDIPWNLNVILNNCLIYIYMYIYIYIHIYIYITPNTCQHMYKYVSYMNDVLNSYWDFKNETTIFFCSLRYMDGQEFIGPGMNT